MSLPPVEIPLGAMRFNSDSQKLEYWVGSAWMQIKTFSPNLDGGARGVCLGGYDDSNPNNTIDFITISTQGNATNFGDLTATIQQNAAFSSNTRGVSAGGENPSATDVIDFVTISSTGNAQDFGNLTTNLRAISGNGFGNQTRGIVVGGYNAPAYSTNIQYVTIASTGNAVDSGADLSEQMTYGGCAASPTRGIIGWGDGSGSPGRKNLIEYVTIASLGNSQTFGELSVLDVAANVAGSNSTRIIWFGGASYPVAHSVIQYATIATGGNALNFGDLSANRFATQVATSPTRGVVMGGAIDSPWGNATNIIEYVAISTLGDSVDFGDLTVARNYGGGLSNAHGGLG